MKPNVLPIDLPQEAVRNSIESRLRRANANLQIWCALWLTDLRHPEIIVLDQFRGFTYFLPGAVITSFFVTICSLFDSGEDCITIFTYQKQIQRTQNIPSETGVLIDHAIEAMKPLRKLRHSHFAHRLASGIIDDVVGLLGLTNNHLIDADEAVTKCVEALFKLDDGRIYNRPNPLQDMSRLISDLASVRRGDAL